MKKKKLKRRLVELMEWNKELKDDIRVLVSEDAAFIKKDEVRMKWTSCFKLESAFLKGQQTLFEWPKDGEYFKGFTSLSAPAIQTPPH